MNDYADPNLPDPLAGLVGEQVVIDMQAPYVCLGTLAEVNAGFLVLHHADLHDLRDTDTSRENYVADSVVTGIKRNRRRVWIARRDVIAISVLKDVVDE